LFGIQENDDNTGLEDTKVGIKPNGAQRIVRFDDNPILIEEKKSMFEKEDLEQHLAEYQNVEIDHQHHH
jgi:hypothetical protein